MPSTICIQHSGFVKKLSVYKSITIGHLLLSTKFSHNNHFLLSTSYAPTLKYQYNKLCNDSLVTDSIFDNRTFRIYSILELSDSVLLHEAEKIDYRCKTMGRINRLETINHHTLLYMNGTGTDPCKNWGEHFVPDNLITVWQWREMFGIWLI